MQSSNLRRKSPERLDIQQIYDAIQVDNKRLEILLGQLVGQDLIDCDGFYGILPGGIAQLVGDDEN